MAMALQSCRQVAHERSEHEQKVAEAKAKFSEISRQVQNGERIVLCKNNKPFAQITPLKPTPEGKRPLGLARGMMPLPKDFNEPDPQLEADFYGNNSSELPAR